MQALFVDPAGEAGAVPRSTTATFGELAFEAKLEQASTTFAPEVDRLDRIADVEDVERLLSSLPVYRTYDGGRSPEDQEALARGGAAPTCTTASRRSGSRAFSRRRRRSWPRASRTRPSTATSACSRSTTSAATRARFGITVEQFHAANRERQERFPRNLLITQTHDTKRSGDVRARIGALSTMAERVRRARERVAARRAADARGAALRLPDAARAPGRSRPTACARTCRRRCARRSAARTGSSPTRTTSGCVGDFALQVPRFPGFAAFAERVAEAGHRSAMAQTLLKLTAPGVPDIYQGDELVALSLVDPDNRRPVDWAKRRAMLGAASPATPATARSSTSSSPRCACAPSGRRRSRAPTSRSTPARTSAPTAAGARSSSSRSCATRAWAPPSRAASVRSPHRREVVCARRPVASGPPWRPASLSSHGSTRPSSRVGWRVPSAS